MNPFRAALALLALVGVVGTFLPWVGVPLLGTFDGTAGDGPGWITAGLFVVSGVVAEGTGPKRPLSLPTAIGCAVPALLAGAYALYKMLDLQRSAAQMAAGNVLAQALISSASVEIGMILVLGCGIVVPLVSVVAFSLGRRRQPVGATRAPDVATKEIRQ